MADLTDQELVEQFRGGNIEGFNALVRRYQERVYWTARRMVGSHEDADDVTQEVFVRAFRGLKGFRGESNVYTWLYRIATNLSLNALRRKKLRGVLRLDDIAEKAIDETQADVPVLQQEYNTSLENAIASLPPRQKQVFVLRYYDELSYDEISAMLGTSVGGLKANYFHALKKLQKAIRKDLG